MGGGAEAGFAGPGENSGGQHVGTFSSAVDSRRGECGTARREFESGGRGRHHAGLDPWRASVTESGDRGGSDVRRKYPIAGAETLR